MNIVIADGLPASAIDDSPAARLERSITVRDGSAAELTADLKDADAFVVRSATKVTRDDDRRGAEAARHRAGGTGVDNVDVPAATARGIVVMNAPGANSLSVAELAMGLILSMARNIPAADASMKTRASGRNRSSREPKSGQRPSDSSVLAASDRKWRHGRTPSR